jgi:hypothetical protein
MPPSKPIVGLVASKHRAERILTALEGAGLSRDDLSVLFADDPSSRGSTGPFIATGPMMAALNGAPAGVVSDGIAGALVRMGIHELEAQGYEAKINGGSILVSVHVDDHEERVLAKTILMEGRALDISPKVKR